MVGSGNLKRIYFFLDDSGTLHKNEKSGFFVYAGYVFVGNNTKDKAKRQYKKLCNDIKDVNGYPGELKACFLKKKHKRALVNVLSMYESISCSVDISRVYPHILSEKLSRFRYKDYIIKRLVKDKINDLINRNIISAHDDIELIINIDEQHTATNGWYDLENSIKEELLHGISNFDYGTTYPPILHGNLTLKIKYCDSKNNYLIQASDIIANYIWHSCIGDIKTFRLPKHFRLQFP